MKNILFPLLICAALLCGCAAQNPIPDTAEAYDITIVPEDVPSASVRSLPKTEDDGALQRYAPGSPVQGFCSLGQQLLLFSGTDTTTLTLLDTQTMQITALHEVGFLLTPENASVQLSGSGLSYFDSSSGETLVLNEDLQEVRRIRRPEDLTGLPLISGDGSTLYYCTASAIRALDVQSGISRILKESSYPSQSLSGLLLQDSVLQISITDTDGKERTLFLSAVNGQLLQDQSGNLSPAVSGSGFCVTLPGSTREAILFGSSEGSPMALYPRETGSTCHFLPVSFRAVTVYQAEDHAVLDLYDLASGSRTASLSPPGGTVSGPVCETEDGSIWFLDTQSEDCLLRWDPDASAVSDSTCYSSLYFTRENPDYDGLAACSLLAQEIGAKYGIEVLIYKDAAAVEPWDYRLEYEYEVPVLRRELERLDASLANFPEGFLLTLRDKYTALKICFVRSAEGIPESGSPEAVNGIQFLDGFDAYVVLAASHDTQSALYHELCHLMETVVLTESTAYDRWDDLNPTDFRYDSSNALRDPDSSWMKPGKEYFIDSYSMTHAREDRARILEYAMTAGHEALFRSSHLQAKLRQLCIGIREAFELEQSPECFLWEQYLAQPLAPQS